MTAALDCQSCGACCIEAGPVAVYTEEEDAAVPRYLTRSVRRTIGFASSDPDFGIRKMAQHLGGRCKALRGEPCVSVRCAIYDRRPAVCAGFEPGSPGCLEARAIAANKLKHPERRPRGYGPSPNPLAIGGADHG